MELMPGRTAGGIVGRAALDAITVGSLIARCCKWPIVSRSLSA